MRKVLAAVTKLQKEDFSVPFFQSLPRLTPCHPFCTPVEVPRWDKLFGHCKHGSGTPKVIGVCWRNCSKCVSFHVPVCSDGRLCVMQISSAETLGSVSPCFFSFTFLLSLNSPSSPMLSVSCGEIRTLCHLRNHLRNLSVSLGAGDCVPLRKVSPVLAL